MTDPATTITASPVVRPRLVPRAGAAVVLLSLPLCILADLPLAGWVTAFVLWAASTSLHAWSRLLAQRSSANAAVGLAAVGMFARMTVSFAAIAWVGMSVDVGETTFGMGRPDAALVTLVIYTLVFTLDMGERIGSDVSARHARPSAPQEEA